MLINHLDFVARVIIIIVIVIKFSVHFTVSPYYYFFFVYPSFRLDVFNNYCLTLCSSY